MLIRRRLLCPCDCGTTVLVIIALTSCTVTRGEDGECLNESYKQDRFAEHDMDEQVIRRRLFLLHASANADLVDLLITAYAQSELMSDVSNLDESFTPVCS